MKFDSARAWKDETYRQSLSEEQLEMLRANPAGEIVETELELVSGGSDNNGFGGLGIAGSSTSNAFSGFEHRDIHWHSLSVGICETNVFSAAQTVAPVTPLLSPITVICANHD